MNGKQQILSWIEDDRERLIEFLQGFLRAKSPNPPGDTRLAANFVKHFLDKHQLEYRNIIAHPEMPNLVASFDASGPGRHLVLNGHLDVFPVGEDETWTHGPWSGDVADGCIWGRGAVDMKCGTTASIFTYVYLHRLRSELKGRLTLTVVSDEETFGPYGARYLMKHHPEVHGDCCLSGEPSDPRTVRFGEKGLLWLRFHVRTSGAHGAYPHTTKSATKIAASIIEELQSIEADIPAPGNAGPVLTASADVIDTALGAGAAGVVQRITVNVGLIQGGVKVNMIPASCRFEVDIRLPIGCPKDNVIRKVDQIAKRYPEATYEELNYSAPNWCDPAESMVRIIRENVKLLRGIDPQPIVGLGATDMRLWRDRGIPAYVYGPSPQTMGKRDERVEIGEFLHILCTHACSAYDYLLNG